MKIRSGFVSNSSSSSFYIARTEKPIPFEKIPEYYELNPDLTEEERYSPDIAHQAYKENLAAKGPELKIGADHKLANHIEKKIAEENQENECRPAPPAYSPREVQTNPPPTYNEVLHDHL